MSERGLSGAPSDVLLERRDDLLQRGGREIVPDVVPIKAKGERVAVLVREVHLHEDAGDVAKARAPIGHAVPLGNDDLRRALNGDVFSPASWERFKSRWEKGWNA